MTAQNLIDKEENLLQLSVHNIDSIFDFDFHQLCKLSVVEFEVNVFATLSDVVLIIQVFQFYLSLQVQSKSGLSIRDDSLDPLQVLLVVCDCLEDLGCGNFCSLLPTHDIGKRQKQCVTNHSPKF